MTFSIGTCQQSVDALKTQHLDVLVIGGGITGTDVALQASTAKMETGLIEMQDFAKGTSSRSTKLVHGGIRYLKTLDVEVVADTVKERAVVQSIAPYVPKADLMLLPIYDEPNATFNLSSVKIAMDLYDQLADVTGTKYANYLLTKDEVLARGPQLKSEGLQGGGVYLDHRNNDARLVIKNIRQAVADGAHAVSRVQAVGFLYNDEGKITSIQAKGLLTDEQFEIHADVVINTTGPWSDKLRSSDENDSFTPQMRPTKGIHLVVDKSRLNVPQPTYLDTGKRDGHMVFIVPREEKTYFGTTGTDYHGDFQHPAVEQSDVDYLPEVVNNRYPEVQLTIDDIEASWAGLRPLISANGGLDYNGGDNSKLSDKSIGGVIDVVDRYQKNQTDKREIEEVLNHLEDGSVKNKVNPSAVSRGSSLERSADGLLTLAGGELTDYRKMAEDTAKMIQTILTEEYQKEFTLIDSKNYPVSGGKLNPATVDEELEALAKHDVSKGLSEKDALYLAHLYGSNILTVSEMINDAEVIPSLTLIEAVSLDYAMEEEMTLTPVGFLLRRTNHLLFMRDHLDQVKAGVIEEMTQHYQRTAEEGARHIETSEKIVEEPDLENLKVG